MITYYEHGGGAHIRAPHLAHKVAMLVLTRSSGEIFAPVYRVTKKKDGGGGVEFFFT